jgi:hypothetical protein
MQSVPITTDVVCSNLVRARCTTLCDKVCQWLATGRWFFQGPPVSSTNKTDRHDIIEILLKVALNTINKQTNIWPHLLKASPLIRTDFRWWGPFCSTFVFSVFLFYLSLFYVLCPLLPVSLDCSLLSIPFCFSKVYFSIWKKLMLYYFVSRVVPLSEISYTCGNIYTTASFP